ncbi:uncharacterized protein TRUGW13939_06969 [Talaromyces rugulosus]|uniref:Uncharacterized protein n=1 Tax=Talaromyces rugulosus TaxID=121627 RepID=A0A7H8R0V2_TALRU|nr:uncharacterized protein TRUGW13939_06969 [Talaromyces rugulosus]QKX59827.1 hypothetical protein TRUGW13939_06969 [Talaromyces rugulosus]
MHAGLIIIQLAESYSKADWHDTPVGHLRLGRMAVVAPVVAADLAAPDGHKGTRVAVGAAPGQDVAVGALHNGEHMTGALVGHFVWLIVVLSASVEMVDEGEEARVVSKTWPTLFCPVCLPQLDSGHRGTGTETETETDTDNDTNDAVRVTGGPN